MTDFQFTPEQLLAEIKRSNKLYLAAYSAGYAAGIKYALARMNAKLDKLEQETPL